MSSSGTAKQLTTVARIALAGVLTGGLLTATAATAATATATTRGTAASAHHRPVAAPSTGCGQDTPVPPGQTTDQQITSGDRARSYLLHLPESYDPGQPLPLVLSFHGHGRTASYQEELTGMSGLDAVVVYPQGLDGTDGKTAWQGAPTRPTPTTSPSPATSSPASKSGSAWTARGSTRRASPTAAASPDCWAASSPPGSPPSPPSPAPSTPRAASAPRTSRARHRLPRRGRHHHPLLRRHREGPPAHPAVGLRLGRPRRLRRRTGDQQPPAERHPGGMGRLCRGLRSRPLPRLRPGPRMAEYHAQP
ncbi:hypothetical protein NKH77_01825 [Streptomyces sp. M19]